MRLSLAEPRGPRTLSYSNTNYLLAGMVLEKVTRRDAMAEVHRRVIAPLDLRHTYLAGSTERIRGPHSKAYIPWLDGNLRDFSVYNMSFGWMLGDLVSTTEDLNTFFHALLTGRLLRPAQLAQMKTTVPFDPADPEIGGYGLGLYTWPSASCCCRSCVPRHPCGRRSRGAARCMLTSPGESGHSHRS